MTTEYRKSHHPQLPENYPAHVQAILSKSERKKARLTMLLEILVPVALGLIAGAVAYYFF